MMLLRSQSISYFNVKRITILNCKSVKVKKDVLSRVSKQNLNYLYKKMQDNTLR